MNYKKLIGATLPATGCSWIQLCPTPCAPSRQTQQTHGWPEGHTIGIRSSDRPAKGRKCLFPSTGGMPAFPSLHALHLSLAEKQMSAIQTHAEKSNEKAQADIDKRTEHGLQMLEPVPSEWARRFMASTACSHNRTKQNLQYSNTDELTLNGSCFTF